MGICAREEATADRMVVEKNVNVISLNRNIFKTSLEEVPAFSYNRIVTYKERGRRTRLESVSAQR